MEKNVTVYCASSPGIPLHYFEAAEKLTEILVSEGYGLLYGGGATGLMGCVADTALKMDGRIKGIIPRFMIEVEWEHKGVKDMVHVDTMHQRKALLIANTSAVVVLPGGSGTLEELYEVVSLKKLGQFPHPIVLLNTKGYFNPLIEMAQKMAEENFMRPEHLGIWDVADTPEGVLAAIRNHVPWGPEVIDFAAIPKSNGKN
ncbi:TIGR00730 family Rossman fold protein [Geofilum rubicundum]|uniref:Cytokinin riboside 5'-monophosphate phosphoribohydrolase n=1 Tax=Geofilum rubicundum JCM 15548 TaxID=1236989 RepID=A0A0E9LYI4_9BACT|nr:TIGR00730 family Rossman fold protein [Geofilum rubicundum]GAO29910.1 lysine decarboxylase family [Geofilum rubicundum JCM 15548]